MVKLLELTEQGQKFVDALRKILLAQHVKTPNLKVVFVVGRPLDEEEGNPELVKAMMDSLAPGSRSIHYDGLISAALES